MPRRRLPPVSPPGGCALATRTVDEGFELRGERTPIRKLLKDMMKSGDLILILAKKDFFVRYRRATLGLLWAIGLPLVQAVVLGVIFSHIVRFKTSTPYPVYVFSGILPWSFFAAGVSLGVTSIVDGSNIASKIYFPRAVLPIETVLAGFYGFIPGVAILIIFSLVMGVSLGANLLLLIPAMITATLLSIAFSLLLGGLQVYFRDVKHIIAAIMLPWFWGSGIIYPLAALGRIRSYLEANPAVGMIQLFRASFGGAADHWTRSLWYTFGWIVVMLVGSLFLYRRYDRVFIDLL